ncbi:Opsin-VA [Varanus komodoensis]|nr:Opsin-VA [Varanus komodoensis]
MMGIISYFDIFEISAYESDILHQRLLDTKCRKLKISGTDILGFKKKIYGWDQLLLGDLSLRGIVALWSLALLAFERYIVICHPLGNMCLRDKHAALGIGFVWVFSFIWTIPTSYNGMEQLYYQQDWNYLYSRDYNDHTFIMTFFTTCFLLPLMVSDTQGRLGSLQKPERQVTRMVVIMIFAFLICWSPYAAFSVLVTACPSIESDPCLAGIPAFFSKIATVYNPIIHVFMNNQLLTHFLRWFLFRLIPLTTSFRIRGGSLLHLPTLLTKVIVKACTSKTSLLSAIHPSSTRLPSSNLSQETFPSLAFSWPKLALLKSQLLVLDLLHIPSPLISKRRLE